MIIFAALIAITALPQKSSSRVFPLRSLTPLQVIVALNRHQPLAQTTIEVHTHRLEVLGTLRGDWPEGGAWVPQELREAGVESLLPAKNSQAVVATGTSAGLLVLQKRLVELDVPVKKLTLTFRLVEKGRVIQQSTRQVTPSSVTSLPQLTTKGLSVFVSLQGHDRPLALPWVSVHAERSDHVKSQVNLQLGEEGKLVFPDEQELFVTATLANEARGK